ncbi:ParA family protein [Prevotella pallens]|uniref:ParA family protein n=1 Tax=Prevotella pallens TaxID=60133 RepID=UPI001CAFF5B4|nr:ParA family protein [Prevotella pallens]MBF1053354.1 ParA family protein [Parvimonas sp.]
MKKTRIITFANHKGGVGKTTTTASVGTILSKEDKKVLLIDLDAQANLTHSIAAKSSIERTIYDALIGEVSKEDSQLPIYQINNNLDIVPADLALANTDLQLSAAMARERILERLLKQVSSQYDYILIDCPPSLGILTLNAIVASDTVIIPLVAEVLPFQGLTMIKDFIEMIKENINPNVSIGGILLTRWENSNLSKQIEEGLREQREIKVYNTKIRKNIKVAEAPLECVNIVEYAPKSNGAIDYMSYTKELIETLKK